MSPPLVTLFRCDLSGWGTNFSNEFYVHINDELTCSAVRSYIRLGREHDLTMSETLDATCIACAHVEHIKPVFYRTKTVETLHTFPSHHQPMERVIVIAPGKPSSQRPTSFSSHSSLLPSLKMLFIRQRALGVPITRSPPTPVLTMLTSTCMLTAAMFMLALPCSYGTKFSSATSTSPLILLVH